MGQNFAGSDNPKTLRKIINNLETKVANLTAALAKMQEEHDIAVKLNEIRDPQFYSMHEQAMQIAAENKRLREYVRQDAYCPRCKAYEGEHYQDCYVTATMTYARAALGRPYSSDDAKVSNGIAESIDGEEKVMERYRFPASGGMIATHSESQTQWTTTPPVAHLNPGYYWKRTKDVSWSKPHVVEVSVNDSCVEYPNIEWWPIPIPEPLEARGQQIFRTQQECYL